MRLFFSIYFFLRLMFSIIYDWIWQKYTSPVLTEYLSLHLLRKFSFLTVCKAADTGSAHFVVLPYPERRASVSNAHVKSILKPGGCYLQSVRRKLELGPHCKIMTLDMVRGALPVVANVHKLFLPWRIYITENVRGLRVELPERGSFGVRAQGPPCACVHVHLWARPAVATTCAEYGIVKPPTFKEWRCFTKIRPK